MPIKGSKKTTLAQEMKEKVETRCDKQAAEFREYLKEKTKSAPDNKFFSKMLLCIQFGEELTENMENAIRKCIANDEVRKKRQNAKPEELPTITLKLKRWLMKEIGIDSLVITGKVRWESTKAWMIEGYADMPADCSFCVRCGRPLTEPASIIAGMGAICAEKAQHPYPAELLNLPAKQKHAYRKKLQAVLQNQKFERIIPKSQAEVLSYTE